MKLEKHILQSTPFHYAESVKSGKIVVGQLIKAAVDRFYKLIESADQKGYRLNHSLGMHVIDFFNEFLTHTKGPKAGQPFTLSPHQQFTYYNIFAWQKQNESGEWIRLITTVYEKVARKNGKTAPLAGVGLYLESFDGESSPEIYVGATKEMQAKILWEQAYQFVFTSPKLRAIGFKNTQREIRFTRNMGVFRFLGSDSKTLDGLSPNASFIDEYHSHKDDSVREVLESAMGARKQPLIYIITTAGFNKSGVCKEYEDVCKDIVKGIKEEDRTFIMIHDLDEDDDWEDETNWVKANPNLGKSVSLDYLRAEYKKAKNQPSKIPNFKTKHLNIWVDSAEVRIPDEIWMQNSAKPILSNFAKYGCASGMDLSSTTDLSAYVLVSKPDEEGFVDILPFIFCPEDTVRQRSKEDAVPYTYWKDINLLDYINYTSEDLEKYSYLQNRKILTATPGNQIDYEYIKNTILQTYWLHKVSWVDYDKHKSTELVQELMKQEVNMYVFPQTINYYSFPTMEFERLLYNGKIRHGGHPILRWMMANVDVKFGINEDVRYIKTDAKKRIDAIQAAVMGLAANLTQEEDNKESQYNTKDKAYI
jgi:phage terminase large subunit-like protein